MKEINQRSDPLSRVSRPASPAQHRLIQLALSTVSEPYIKEPRFVKVQAQDAMCRGQIVLKYHASTQTYSFPKKYSIINL